MKLSSTFQFVFGAVSLIAFHLARVDACQCVEKSQESQYCDADWVSHVRVNEVARFVLMPPQIETRQIPDSTKYEVQHIKVFKNSNKDDFPCVVYTPEENGACGILLGQGHEYLLAGRIVDGTLIVTSCDQIRPKDLTDLQRFDIFEWKDVPRALRKQLETGEIGKKCEN